MANPQDPSGIPFRRNPDDSGASDGFFENSRPAAGETPEGEEPQERPVRRSPITPPSSAFSFESNPGVSSSPKNRPSPAPSPRPDDEDFELDEPQPDSLPSQGPVAPSRAAARDPAAARQEGKKNEEEVEEMRPARPRREAEAPPEVTAPAPTPAAGTSASRSWWHTSKTEKLGIAAVLAVMLIMAGIFSSSLYAGRPASADSSAQAVPSLPMKGNVATITKIDTLWRPTKTSDRVSMVDTLLPEVSRYPSALLPEVKFSIDPGASKTGFLRFLFLDSDGQITGDVLVLKVNQGKLESVNSGAEVASPTDGVLYCSLGFLDKASYMSYALSGLRRWSVEISESTDYSAREEGWKRLGLFEVRDHQL
ncbi:MAG: hypothetical protein JWM59_3214 [Verrucomicrobiales bacterium]|nr:hypothetical protein [Verrucomicrobiales bacterium]